MRQSPFTSLDTSLTYLKLLSIQENTMILVETDLLDQHVL